MPHQWFKVKLSTRSWKVVGHSDHHPDYTKTKFYADKMVGILKKQGFEAKTEVDSYGGVHKYIKILAKDKPLSTYKGIAWVHPRGGGDDFRVRVTVKAKDLEEAKEMVRKHLVVKHHTHKEMADDFSIKKVKR